MDSISIGVNSGSSRIDKVHFILNLTSLIYLCSQSLAFDYRNHMMYYTIISSPALIRSLFSWRMIIWCPFVPVSASQVASMKMWSKCCHKYKFSSMRSNQSSIPVRRLVHLRRLSNFIDVFNWCWMVEVREARSSVGVFQSHKYVCSCLRTTIGLCVR